MTSCPEQSLFWRTNEFSDRVSHAVLSSLTMNRPFGRVEAVNPIVNRDERMKVGLAEQ